MVVTLEETIDELEGKFRLQKVQSNVFQHYTQKTIIACHTAWQNTFLDEVHEAKLRNKESEQSLDQIFNEVATA